MHATELFELVIAMFVAIIALHWVGRKLHLPPSVALLTGGALLAFVPGIPTIEVDPELVLVIFLPPLLFDGAWSIALGPLRRHKVGIASLAIGAVFFTCAVVAVVTKLLFPELPWAACAVLGAIVAPPDAVSARAVLERVKLPRRLQILLEGESLLNDASGLVLFRFAIAAGLTGAFSLGEAAQSFVLLAVGGAAIGAAVGFSWALVAKRLGDEYLMIAATALLSWTSYLLGEFAHVSGVIAAVTAGMIASWHSHTVFSASGRMRGTSFWVVTIFLMEAAVFILIGLSLRGVVERAGGFGVILDTMGLPIVAILVALTLARFAWVFGSDAIIAAVRAMGFEKLPLGPGAATVLSWAGVRGVVTLALALSVPDGFPGRDFILVTAFAVILGTVLIQGTTLGAVINWASLSEPTSDRPRVSLNQAEAAMAKVQLETVTKLAYDDTGELKHAQLLERYTRKANASARFVEETERYTPLLHAHFDVILEAIAVGRAELLRLHRQGDVDDETLFELERDLDIEELGALAAKA
jgi:CPA1 family monovalent cation:H+ antiporter